jgi:hypothetical protein
MPQEGAMSKPKPPSGLESAGAALWRDVVGKYDLRVDELAVLEAACKTADMIAILDKEWSALGKPFLTRGSMGQDVIHPLIGERRAQQSAQAALFRQLKLPDEAGGAGESNQQRSAAQSRWAAAHGAGA